MCFCAMFFCVWTFINCILIVSLCDCHTHSLKATWLDLTWLYNSACVRDSPEIFAYNWGFSGSGCLMTPDKFYHDQPPLPWQRHLGQNRRAAVLGDRISIPIPIPYPQNPHWNPHGNPHTHGTRSTTLQHVGLPSPICRFLLFVR